MSVWSQSSVAGQSRYFLVPAEVTTILGIDVAAIDGLEFRELKTRKGSVVYAVDEDNFLKISNAQSFGPGIITALHLGPANSHGEREVFLARSDASASLDVDGQSALPVNLIPTHNYLQSFDYSPQTTADWITDGTHYWSMTSRPRSQTH